MLDIGVWNFIWPIINIVLLFILLRIFLFKPLNKMMEERTTQIQNDLDEAEKARKEAEELAQQNKEALVSARDEAQKILNQAREEASVLKTAMLQESETKAQQIIDNANKTIESERKKAVQDAQSEIADLAIAAATKIIGENVDDDKNRRLVDNFLTEENRRLSHDTSSEEGAADND